MLRLKDVPPEQMPEVVRIANQLYEKDQRLAEQDQERDSYVTAAEELGVPKEYMERAAEELHRRRVVDAQERQQHSGKKLLLGAAVGAGILAFVLAGLIGTTAVVSRTPGPRRAAPVMSAPPSTVPTSPLLGAQVFESFDSNAELRWTFDKNASTRAGVTYQQEGERGTVAVIRVDQFGAVNGKEHRANFDSVMAPPTAAQKEMAFDMRGEGLRKVRVYLEQGNAVRWRSDELTIPSGWSTFRINLDNFQRQVPNGNRWRNEGRGRPDVVTRVSFKFGDFMNAPSDKGEVRLDNIRFQ